MIVWLPKWKSLFHFSLIFFLFTLANLELEINYTVFYLVVKLEDGEITEHAGSLKDAGQEGTGAANQSDRKPSDLQHGGWSRRDGHQKVAKVVI